MFGGAIAVLIDNCIFSAVRSALGWLPSNGVDIYAESVRAFGVTASLEVEYHAPVPLLETVQIRCWVARIEQMQSDSSRRKIWVKSVLEQPGNEREDGGAFVSSTALIITFPGIASTTRSTPPAAEAEGGGGQQPRPRV